MDHEVVLITPLTLEKRDLGLLLGICKKLAINVAGIVANATLAIQSPTKDCKTVYIDLLQQQLAFTEIIQSDTEISLKQPSCTLNYGLQQLIKNNAKSIAKKFIAETRFDPLHLANDEQQFFDKLPLWLKMLNHNNIAIYCSSSCKQVFGLHEFLTNLPGCAILQLDEISLAAQAVNHKNSIISGKQVHYIKTLPWNADKITAQLDFSPGRLSNLSKIPTHILISGHAHSLQNNVFIANNDVSSDVRITFEKNPDSLCRVVANKLSVEVQTYNKQPIYLNQNEIETTATASIGDRLSINGLDTDFTFIKVIENET